MEINQYSLFKGAKNGSIGIFKGGSEASAYSRVGLIYLHIQKYVFTYFHIQVYVFLEISIFKGMFFWKVPYSRVCFLGKFHIQGYVFLESSIFKGKG